MFYVRLAELNIRIENRWDYVEAMCRDFIVPPCEPDFSVSATDEDMALQRTQQTDLPLSVSDGEVEALCIYRAIGQHLPQYDAFIVHGAALEKDGRGYVFLAKSGVGKSTHCFMWHWEYRGKVRMINGDKPIFRRIDGAWRVYGTPWCGKEHLFVNDSAPLSALCFLERGEVNEIRPASNREITDRLFSQLLLPQDRLMLARLITLLDSLLTQTPKYILRCTPDPEAARVACEGMEKPKS